MSARLRSALLTALVLGLAAGCEGEPNPPPGDDGVEDDGAADDGDGTGDTSDDGEADDGEAADPIAGRYQIDTTYDLSGAPVVPGLIGNSLVALTQLKDDPAGTLLDLADAANLPVLDQLLAVLPDVLLDQLAGFINDFLFDRLVAEIPAAEAFTTLVADLSGLLTNFDVMSQLELSEQGPAGAVTGTHMLTGVRFTWRGQDVLVDTPELLDEITIARDVVGSVSLGGPDGLLEIGDHAFHLPLGDFAVIGANLALSQVLGVADLRDLLGALFDCPALAESVASRCLGPLCVGHREEIEAVCESGLDLVVDQLEERVSNIDFTEMRFSSGDAVLRDAAEPGGEQDGRIDLLEGGHWQSMVVVDGAAEVPIPSPFVGHRVGD